jgi:hypothetical protein
MKSLKYSTGRTGAVRKAFVLVFTLAVCNLSQAGHRGGVEPLPQTLLSSLSARSLRGHLSFVASDLLEGRDTPSRGLDICSEYIGAQFRRSGLEPAGSDGYFQIANWPATSENVEGFKLEFKVGHLVTEVPASLVRWASDRGLNFTDLPVVKLRYEDVAEINSLTAAGLTGRAIMSEPPDLDHLTGSQKQAAARAWYNLLTKVGLAAPSCFLAIGRSAPQIPPRTRLVNPQRGAASEAGVLRPQVTVYDPQVVALYDCAMPNSTFGAISTRILPDIRTTVALRNVIGFIRGADPQLSDTYILITAHYDHLGLKDTGTGDRIYNGANDDGSGVVSVMELASAFAGLSPRPRRSIVFATFFGEEKGLLGSRYYGQHPVFPIGKTIAQINLEQVGRTDDDEGPQLGTATLTGMDYSEIGALFQSAGEDLGMRVYRHPQKSDAYFGRSDNQSLADQGVPAHTLAVAFSYPDYHSVNDHWDKIDYENLVRVDRLVALAVYRIAQSTTAPQWDSKNPKAAKYVEAWKKNHAE